MGAITIQVPPLQGKLWGFDIRILSPRRFSIAKGGTKSKVLTSSLSPGGGAHSSALKAEKSQSLPVPVGGGALVTNDWCIIFDHSLFPHFCVCLDG